MLQSTGAWRSLKQLGDLRRAANQSMIDALIIALCFSPFEDPYSGRDSLIALAELAPRSACAIALSRTLLALSQECILTGRVDEACAMLRQAIASSLNAVVVAGMPINPNLYDQLLDNAEGLRRTLASQLSLALASQRNHLPNQLVMVLGMHRSGTSAMSGLLVKAGLDAPQDLMPPTKANPRGYWESLGAMQLNDKMLQQLGSEWNNPRTLHGDGWGMNETSACEWRAGLLNLLRSSYPAGGCALLKDPRLCVLLPGLRPWLESRLMTCVVFLPVRHPAEVAASLKLAEGTLRSQALLLWLGHVFQAERYSRGLDRLIVNYQQMLSNPDVVLEQCRNTIEQACAGRGMKISWKQEASSFIDPQLHRQRTDQDTPSWVLDEDAEVWYDLALRVHSVMVNPNSSEQERNEDLDQLWRQWTTLAP